MEDAYASTKEACKLLGDMSPGTLRKLANQGKLNPVRFSARVVRWPVEDLRRFIAKASGTPDE